MRRPQAFTIDHASYIGGATDPLGDEVDAWFPPVEVSVWAIAPGHTTEPEEPGHDRVVTEATIYAPASFIPEPHDRVTFWGSEWAVHGEPKPWVHPWDTTRNGVEVKVRRVDG